MLNDPIIRDLLLEIVEDEEIAEKTGIRLNIVRKILYKLYDEGLASYRRDKDKETQWYTYDWKFKVDEVEKLKEKRNEEDLAQLKAMLDEEENNMYFICPYGHYRLNFENASDPRVEFLCPECDAELVHDDNQDIIDDLKRRIKAIEDQM